MNKLYYEVDVELGMVFIKSTNNNMQFKIIPIRLFKLPPPNVKVIYIQQKAVGE